MEILNKYLHTYIDKYQEEMDKLSPYVQKDGYSEQEKYFAKIKENINEIFDFTGKHFMIVEYELQDWSKKKTICPAYIAVDLSHQMGGKEIMLKSLNLQDNKMIDITTNAKILEFLDKDVKYVEVLEKLFKNN